MQERADWDRIGFCLNIFRSRFLETTGFARTGSGFDKVSSCQVSTASEKIGHVRLVGFVQDWPKSGCKSPRCFCEIRNALVCFLLVDFFSLLRRINFCL